VPSVDDLTPSQKGAAAEAAIAAMVIELGLTVLRPLSEGRRYDVALCTSAWTPLATTRPEESNGRATTSSER
jgi:hypothetical protein